MSEGTLPTPDCRYGYTVEQVQAIMGGREVEFREWLRGQTMMMCSGIEYDHELKQHHPSPCGQAHGPIVFAVDVRRFLNNQPVID